MPEESWEAVDETNRDDCTLTIRGDETSVFCAAVRALLQEAAPGAHIVFAPADSPVPPKALRIEDGGDRWMCVLRRADDFETAREALRAGAWCLTSLDDAMERFARTVRELVDGTPHNVSLTLARLITGSAVTEPVPAPVDQNHPPLTRRERDVLALLSHGLSNASIAAELGISVHTVRTHLSSMATKIDARNRIRLVSRARELGYREAGGD